MYYVEFYAVVCLLINADIYLLLESAHQALYNRGVFRAIYTLHNVQIAKEGDLRKGL